MSQGDLRCWLCHGHLPINITLGGEVVVEVGLAGGSCVVGQYHCAIWIFLAVTVERNTRLDSSQGKSDK